MRSVIIVHPNFDKFWPWSADHAHAQWSTQGEVEFIRQKAADTTPVSEMVSRPHTVTRMIVFGTVTTAACAAVFSGLQEISIESPTREPFLAALVARGVRYHAQPNEGYWGQSVAEFGLALTLCGLRRIPQMHLQIITDLSAWDYEPAGGVGVPGTRGYQYGDDNRFTNGTLAGKKVRIVGAGNIASRYASFATVLGADVAVWDPYASEPCFHRAGSRREWHLERLVSDAEIFVPMVPLTPQTEGLITAAHIDALPRGCLVVMVTRALICDMVAVRRRVLSDDLALAADVFEVEPVPLNDPLLGRHNVVHSPHNAGRTRQANERFSTALIEQFC